MANRRASIWKYIRVGTAWRYCKPVYASNGKLKPDWVHVYGHEERHEEGAYYLRLSANGGSWKKIGPKAADAVRAQEYEETALTAKAMGIPLKEDTAPPLLLSPSLWGFLEDYRLSQQPESYNLMKHTLEEFAGFIKTQALADITRLDLLKYKQWLQTRPASQGAKNTLRTAGNKLMRVNQYLRSVQGIDAGRGLVTVKDAKFVEEEPEVFTDEELEKFFAECSEFQFLVFNTYLMSGLRKQELENLEWQDLNFAEGTLKVSAKPARGFQPKTWEERTIELPEWLNFRLATHRDTWRWIHTPDAEKPDYTLPRSSLVFANSTGHKYTHSWDDCRSIAERAHVVDAHPHKFRATYATRLLQSGIVLKDVQKLLGHKTIESTMRYLAKSESPIMRKKLDAVWGSAFGSHMKL